jgi:hypothetical protein
MMERRPFWQHDRRNLQADALNQLAGFWVEDRTTWGTGHEYHESRFAARLRKFSRGPNSIEVKGTGATGDQ